MTGPYGWARKPASPRSHCAPSRLALCGCGPSVGGEQRPEQRAGTAERSDRRGAADTCGSFGRHQSSLTNCVQLTTDARKTYLDAVDHRFGSGLDMREQSNIPMRNERHPNDLVVPNRHVRSGMFVVALLSHPVQGATAGLHSVQLTDLGKTCVAAPAQRDEWGDLDKTDDCHVVRSGPVAGSNPPLYFQMQAYLQPGQQSDTRITQFTWGREFSVGSPDNDGAGVALLKPVGDRQQLELLQGWSGADAVITDVPRVVRTPHGPILVVRMDAIVSSVPQQDVVLRSAAGHWRVLDTDQWMSAITVPRGTAQRHGSAMDWPTLRAFGAFWRPKDSECCPTGGSYIAQLDIKGVSLRARRVRYWKDEHPFP